MKNFPSGSVLEEASNCHELLWSKAVVRALRLRGFVGRYRQSSRTSSAWCHSYTGRRTSRVTVPFSLTKLTADCCDRHLWFDVNRRRSQPHRWRSENNHLEMVAFIRGASPSAPLARRKALRMNSQMAAHPAFRGKVTNLTPGSSRICARKAAMPKGILITSTSPLLF
jgi:hypothetical protein